MCGGWRSIREGEIHFSRLLLLIFPIQKEIQFYHPSFFWRAVGHWIDLPALGAFKPFSFFLFFRLSDSLPFPSTSFLMENDSFFSSDASRKNLGNKRVALSLSTLLLSSIQTEKSLERILTRPNRVGREFAKLNCVEIPKFHTRKAYSHRNYLQIAPRKFSFKNRYETFS